MQQTRVQKHVFIFIAMYQVVLLMEYFHTKNEKYFLCVPVILVL